MLSTEGEATISQKKEGPSPTSSERANGSPRHSRHASACRRLQRGQLSLMWAEAPGVGASCARVSNSYSTALRCVPTYGAHGVHGARSHGEVPSTPWHAMRRHDSQLPQGLAACKL